MLGYIHVCLKGMIMRYNGADVYKQVLKQAGYEESIEWDSKTVYPDQDTYRLMRALGTILKLNSEDVWEKFGAWFAIYVTENGWIKFLNVMSNDLHEFLENLSSMHFFIDRIAFQELKGPSFKCEAKPDGTLRLHYYSIRNGLYPMAKGMIKQAAKILFGLDIKMIVTERSHERRNELLTEHVIFTLESEDEFTPLTRSVETKETSVPKPLPMNVNCFCTLFPTHITFNKSLIIEHCGEFLQKEFVITRRRMTKLSDLLTLVQPDDISLTFKSISTYLNSLFIFSFKQPMGRNEVEKKKLAFMLKGQMILVNNGNSVLYMNSPYIINPKTMIDANLYLVNLKADMQQHDATRDLIMLNQTRISQQNMNRQLDITSKQLKIVGDDLERKNEKFDLLIQTKIPDSIFELVKNEEKVPTREFKSITCLYVEIPHFNVILKQCEPREVFSFVNELFQKFDRLVKLHSCFKVNCLFNSYMAVCGAPDFQAENADQILNLALGMMFEAKHTIVPRLNLPVLIRIGIHSGSSRGGLLGLNQPRYCIFSDLIDVCQKLLTHIEPGKILLTNSTKVLASKSTRNDFVFTTKGYLKIGGSQATCTFYLDYNARKSIPEIVHSDLEENDAGTGHKDLLMAEISQSWDSYEPSSSVHKEIDSENKTKLNVVNRILHLKSSNNTTPDSGISASSDGSKSCSIV